MRLDRFRACATDAWNNHAILCFLNNRSSQLSCRQLFVDAVEQKVRDVIWGTDEVSQNVRATILVGAPITSFDRALLVEPVL